METNINIGNLGFQSTCNSEYVDKSELMAIVNKTLFTEFIFSCVLHCRCFGKLISIRARNWQIVIDAIQQSKDLLQATFGGLRRTMESVIYQSCQDFKYVVIDGESTVGSQKDIMEHQARLPYRCLEPGRGIYLAMTKGVSHATGKYCLFLNSGDYLYNKDMVKEVLPALDGRYDIVYGIIYVIKLDGTITFRTGEFRHDTNSIQLINDTICHLASLIKKVWLERCPYDENYRIGSDKKFFLDYYFIHNCSCHYIDKIVSLFPIGGISNTTGPKGLLAEETDNMMPKLFPTKLVEDLKLMDSKLLYLWGQIPTSYRLRKALISMMNIIIKAYRFFKKDDLR